MAIGGYKQEKREFGMRVYPKLTYKMLFEEASGRKKLCMKS